MHLLMCEAPLAHRAKFLELRNALQVEETRHFKKARKFVSQGLLAYSGEVGAQSPDLKCEELTLHSDSRRITGRDKDKRTGSMCDSVLVLVN